VLLPDMNDLGIPERAEPGSFNVGPGEIWLSGLEVPEGITATVIGPATVVLKNLTVAGQGTLKFDASGGPIAIYVMNEFRLIDGSTLGHVAGGADEISIFIDELASSDLSRPPTVDLSGGTGEFHGLIYAPLADVTIPSGLRVFGGIVANRLELEAGSRYTYDQGLATKAAGMESMPQLLSWVVEPLPDEAIVRSKTDPMKFVENNGIPTKPSSDSHREQSFKLTYQDAGGTFRTYDGDPALLDWNDVRVTYEVTWDDPDTGLPMTKMTTLNNIKTIN